MKMGEHCRLEAEGHPRLYYVMQHAWEVLSSLPASIYVFLSGFCRAI